MNTRVAKRRRRFERWLVWLGALSALLLSPATISEDGDDLDRAMTLITEERYAEARELVAPFLRREPEHPRARLLDGILHAHAGRAGRAIFIFDELRVQHPDMVEAYNNLAVLQAMEGRLDEARANLLTSIERRPSAIAYANLGDVYADLSRRAYRQAAELGEGMTQREADEDAGAVLAVPGGAVPSPRTTPRGAPAAGGTEEAGAGVVDPVAPAAPSGAASVAAPAPRGSEPGVRCVRAGAFKDRPASSDAEGWLRSQGVEEARARREPSGKVKHYRVYLPPLASRKAAAAMVAEIRSRGVADVALIRGGDLRNGVSLGVYSVEKNLRRRIAGLADLGYPVRWKDYRPLRYVIRGRASGDPAALAAGWAAKFPGHSIEFVDCG